MLFIIIFVVLKKISLSYKNWSDFLYFIILMSGVMCFWLLIVKIINFLDCGISCQDNSYIIKYSKNFKFHTVIIPKDKISKIFYKFDSGIKFKDYSHEELLSMFKENGIEFSEITF